MTDAPRPPRPPGIAWFRARRQPLLNTGAVLVVGLFLALMLLRSPSTGSRGEYRLPGDRFPQLEADVRHALPLGLEIDAAGRALDSMGITHSRVKTDSRRLVALVPRVLTTTRFTQDARFEFLFDSTGRLMRIDAQRIYKGF